MSSPASHSPAPNGRVELRLPADHRFTRLGRRVVERLAVLQGFDERRVEELSLVASELLSNCVDHAAPAAGPLWMGLALQLEPKAWSLEVSDQGGGNAALLQAELDRPVEDSLDLLDPDQERGRGLLLLKSLVDRLSASPSADGRGLCLMAHKQWD
jgi:anti-sigma regulatory factor (Ser/Thr protein kinase)